MKKIILTVCFVGLVSSTYAEAFKIGENRASFGIGFGWINKGNYSNSLHFPSPNMLIERSIVPFKDLGFLSIGAQFGFHHGFHNGTLPPSFLEYKQSWTSFYFVPRVALYFHELFHEDDFPENIDLYGGVGFGFNFLSHKTDPPNILDDESGFKLGYRFFLGGRYYFNKKMAAFAEIGYGLSVLNVGLTIRY